MQPILLKNQRLEDVAYAVFFGDATNGFPPKALVVLDTMEHAWCHFRVHAAIIGQSHFLVVYDEHGKGVFAEMLACVDLQSLDCEPSSVDMLVPALQLERSYAVCGDALWIESRITVRTVYERAVLEVSPRATGMTFVFPGSTNPRTVVVCGEREDGLYVRTLHEYEKEGGWDVVETQTVLRRGTDEVS